jgi:hypothetical protein
MSATIIRQRGNSLSSTLSSSNNSSRTAKEFHQADDSRMGSERCVIRSQNHDDAARFAKQTVSTVSYRYNTNMDGRGVKIMSQWNVDGIIHRFSLAIVVLLMVVPWIHHSSLSHATKVLSRKIEGFQRQQTSLTETLDIELLQYQTLLSSSSKIDDHNSGLFKNMFTTKQGTNVEDDNYRYGRANVDRILENGDASVGIDRILDYIIDENNQFNEDTYQQRIENMQQEVKGMARNNLSRKYGNQSIECLRVIVTLQEDILHGTVLKELQKTIKGDQFTIEMGPASIFAHAVDHFLRLAIDEQYYDGLSLMVQEGYKGIKTIPRNHKTGSILDENVSSSQQSLLFTEYHELHEKKKYSVCFTSDGGPHFYINMDLPNENHVSDTCFGRIRDGRAPVEFMFREQFQQRRIKDSSESKKLYMIGIKSVLIDQTSLQ